MAVHLIDIRSDVLLRFTPFILFVYSFLCYDELSDNVVLLCGIRVTQNAFFQFMHLFRLTTFFCICMMLREAVRNVDLESHRIRQKRRPADRDRQTIG